MLLLPEPRQLVVRREAGEPALACRPLAELERQPGLAAARTPAQVEASRRNGAMSLGPVTAEARARSALNGTRHGLCSAQFFLLPDEDPAEYAAFLAGMLRTLNPTDDAERHAAERAVQGMWREQRADRMEVEILSARRVGRAA